MTQPVSIDSDAQVIVLVQDRLVEWGWLPMEVYVPGELDEATVQAVTDFQNYYTENTGETLLPMYAELPVIETDTLAVLMADGDVAWLNPEM